MGDIKRIEEDIERLAEDAEKLEEDAERLEDDLEKLKTKIHIKVNGKPVVMHQRRATGYEIKAAAIAQNVAIEINFILQEELPNGHSRIVGDNDPVKLREHERFTAIPNDDNS